MNEFESNEKKFLWLRGYYGFAEVAEVTEVAEVFQKISKIVSRASNSSRNSIKKIPKILPKKNFCKKKNFRKTGNTVLRKFFKNI